MSFNRCGGHCCRLSDSPSAICPGRLVWGATWAFLLPLVLVLLAAQCLGPTLGESMAVLLAGGVWVAVVCGVKQWRRVGKRGSDVAPE